MLLWSLHRALMVVVQHTADLAGVSERQLAQRCARSNRICQLPIATKHGLDSPNGFVDQRDRAGSLPCT